jgi:hypothetical protein
MITELSAEHWIIIRLLKQLAANGLPSSHESTRAIYWMTKEIPEKLLYSSVVSMGASLLLEHAAVGYPKNDAASHETARQLISSLVDISAKQFDEINKLKLEVNRLGGSIT